MCSRFSPLGDAIKSFRASFCEATTTEEKDLCQVTERRFRRSVESLLAGKNKAVGRTFKDRL